MHKKKDIFIPARGGGGKLNEQPMARQVSRKDEKGVELATGCLLRKGKKKGFYFRGLKAWPIKCKKRETGGGGAERNTN